MRALSAWRVLGVVEVSMSSSGSGRDAAEEAAAALPERCFEQAMQVSMFSVSDWIR